MKSASEPAGVKITLIGYGFRGIELVVTETGGEDGLRSVHLAEGTEVTGLLDEFLRGEILRQLDAEE